MIELGRRFAVVCESGRTFTVIEYSNYRWERNAADEHCHVQTATTHLMTKCGLEVWPTEEPWSYRIPALGLTVQAVDEDALQRPARSGETEIARYRVSKTAALT
jgi:hypothetical protein